MKNEAVAMQILMINNLRCLFHVVELLSVPDRTGARRQALSLILTAEHLPQLLISPNCFPSQAVARVELSTHL
jgi:hypothetical protein